MKKIVFSKPELTFFSVLDNFQKSRKMAKIGQKVKVNHFIFLSILVIFRDFWKVPKRPEMVISCPENSIFYGRALTSPFWATFRRVKNWTSKIELDKVAQNAL